MVDKYRIGLLICGLLLSFFLSCGTGKKELEDVLSLSGENRRELDLVLGHYKDSTLKLRAAEFLICNMIGLSTPDTISLASYRPFYNMCDSVRMRYKYTNRRRWATLIDSLWDVYNMKNTPKTIRNVPLLKSITAKQLIAEIDLAFDAWQNNEFTKDCSFEDFCEYILPSYRGNSFVIDNARSSFNQLHKGYYKDNRKSLLAETDSVLSFYKEIDYDTFYGSSIPVLSAEALIHMGGGRCTERGILNSLLLSALGVPVAVDFVPIWANKVDAHSWNVLVIKGKHYAFDPFWNKDNWVYNDLYGNKGVYGSAGFGEFRVAKIFRKTYSTHMESTLLDKGIATDDVPPLFRNYKMKDVSSDYFETADVEVNLTETPPQDARYAYLCVYGPKEWLVMQYGEIINGKAIFKGMGKNIVYLPAYFKNRTLQAAAAPFWLSNEGKSQNLTPLANINDKVVISSVEPYHWNSSYLNCMNGTCITGRISKGEVDTLCVFSSGLTMQHTTYEINSASSYRYLRLNLPSDSIALGDLSFYSSKGKIPNVKITSNLYPLGKQYSQDLLFDKFKYSCFRGKSQDHLVDIDLGNEYILTAIDIYPYLKPLLSSDSSYELLYWENGWKSLGEQKGGVDYLIFKNAPRNALFRLRQTTIQDGTGRERIFMYRDGEVIWM